jgi:hypothetical protein
LWTSNGDENKSFLDLCNGSLIFWMTNINSAFASPVFSDGFESGDFSRWAGTSGTPMVTNLTAFEGNYSQQVNMNNKDYSYIDFGNNPLLHFSARFYVKFTGYPSDFQGKSLIIILHPSRSVACSLEYFNKGGGICEWLLWSGTDYGPDSGYVQQLNLNQWYNIEVEYYANGENSQYHAWVDGILVQTTNDSKTLPAQIVGIGSAYITTGTGIWLATGYFDNVVISLDYNGPTLSPTPEPTLNPTPSLSPSNFPSVSPAISASLNPTEDSNIGARIIGH